MLGHRGLREGAHGQRGWAPGPAKDAGEREGGRVPVCGGSALGCLPLMATQMAFTALIYRALLGVESG